jgi:hypothetical protein
MDALIEEASTTAQLLNEILLNGPVVQDDVLLDVSASYYITNEMY